MGEAVAGSVNGGPIHILFDKIELGATEALYFGKNDTNGSWRLIRSGNDLVIQRREMGSWVTKSTISA